MGIFDRFFKSNVKKTLPDLSFIGGDMHSHFIPAIDDGSKSVEETMMMLQSLSDLGINKFITTPHIMGDHYKNSKETIFPGLEKVQKAIKEAGKNWEIRAAAEYYLDEEFLKLLDAGNILTLKDNLVLVEFSYANRPANMKDILFAIKINGYQPILAHPERYPYFNGSMREYEDLLDYQVLFQLNLASLSGMYSSGAQKVAQDLIQEKMVTYVGTDMHNMRNYPFYQALLENQFFVELMESGRIKNAELFR
jgi:tyrosine-protein phosphatase YwqE